MKYIKQQKVSASITDSTASLSVIGAFQIVEDAVTELMGELKIDGVTAKREYNAVWVFIKNRIKILKSIAWNESCEISCFISAVSRATISVDVLIENAAGELCICARVELCALDLDTGRIRKVETVGVDGSITVEPAVMNVDFTRFDKTEPPECGKVRVGYTNIDFARHTNNVEYIRFMLDTYSVAEMEARPIKEMEIVYINQSFENDVITVCRGSVDGKDVFLLKISDKPVAKSEIVFA